MKFTMLYSKTKSEKNTIFLRHRYRINGKEKEIKLNTPFSLEADNWDDDNEMWDVGQKIKSPRKPEDKIRNKEIDDFNADFALLKKKVEDYIKENPYPNREDLKELMFGKKELPAVKTESYYPEDFCEFVNFFIQEKSKLIPGKQLPLKKRSTQKYIQLQNKVQKYYPGIKITEIDDDFRDSFSALLSKLKYKPSYIMRQIKIVKTICTFANKKLDINKEVLFWKFVNTDFDKFLDPIFTFEELAAIKKLKFTKDSYLDNARDWLIISCYTGQRVSDLLNMSSKNIVHEEFYTVHQQKGQKDVTIWLMPEVFEILNKRNGEFPRKISAVRYNEYIKKVAEKAEINQIIKGGKRIKDRRITDFYPKWQLITSHIGRRTFVSLFETIIGKENIKTQTGHTTDDMVNLYNKTEAIDKAKRIKEAYQRHSNTLE